jgi:heme/copper-type cytochrome/quinol oxidase subunit 2
VISSSTPASSGAGIDYLWTVVAIASLVAVSLVVMILLERRRKKDAGMQAVSPNYEDLSAGNHLEPPSQG